MAHFPAAGSEIITCLSLQEYDEAILELFVECKSVELWRLRKFDKIQEFMDLINAETNLILAELRTMQNNEHELIVRSNLIDAVAVRDVLKIIVEKMPNEQVRLSTIMARMEDNKFACKIKFVEI